MAPSNSTKKILEDFIEIYRSHPCLWQMKNKEYHDRDKKEAAYKLLIEKLREIEPDANKAVVVRKINNLRSNVRKEKKKYEQSLKSGASADDVYCTKLWYYDLFNFVHDRCTPRESSSNLDSDDENSCEKDNTEDSSTADQQYSSNNVSTDNNDPRLTSSNNNSYRLPKPGKTKNESIANDVSESVRDHFKRPRPIVTEDRCDIIGKNVAMKLRALDAKQILVAEKLINDLLFEAEIGHLSPAHAYINMRDVLRQNQQSYVPAHQNRQVYQSSPTSNRSYTPVSLVSSKSPSPPCLPFPTNQYSEHLSQSSQISHTLNSPQGNSYSTQMQTPTIPGNRPGETEALLLIPDSAATFINNFNVDYEALKIGIKSEVENEST